MNNDTESEVKSLCRLCLIHSKVMESLHNPLDEIFEDEVISLFDVMEKLSLTKVSRDSKYPSRLCLNCVTLLNTAYQVNRLIQISQSQLSMLFRENLRVIDRRKGFANTDVEIISDKGKYNLKDVLIIEEEKKQKPSFNGFLRNLGTVISADFVTKRDKKKDRRDEIHTINVIPLSKGPENYMLDCGIEETDSSKDSSVRRMRIATVRVKSKTSLKCNLCNKIFKTRRSLSHHKETHREKKAFLCQTCGYVTNVRTTLTNHMMLKHQGKRFTCEVCGKKYLSNSHLRYHMIKHKNERLHLCTVCGKNFNYRSSLEYHMRVHTGEKKFKCTYCDRGFSMRCGLNRHLRTHTGFRPYKCSFCEKAFRSKGEVDCHEMTHTGFRPYHCKLCLKGFTKMHNLKIHMLSHSGPLLCEFCQRGFTEIGYLKLHMKVTHGLNNYDATGCQLLIVPEDGANVEHLDEALIIATE